MLHLPGASSLLSPPLTSSLLLPPLTSSSLCTYSPRLLSPPLASSDLLSAARCRRRRLQALDIIVLHVKSEMASISPCDALTATCRVTFDDLTLRLSAAPAPPPAPPAPPAAAAAAAAALSCAALSPAVTADDRHLAMAPSSTAARMPHALEARFLE